MNKNNKHWYLITCIPIPCVKGGIKVINLPEEDGASIPTCGSILTSSENFMFYQTTIKTLHLTASHCRFSVIHLTILERNSNIKNLANWKMN